ncbi:MAG TPA: 30S ribosomal protein S6--L-glutamate ligase, partial [Saprospiraceae bacterium]|nr:30S ribosomal protein S6--L-glutamate ligase [Saprospiraceae bacterium]
AAMERSAQNGEFRSNLHRGASSHKIRITSEEEEIALRAAQLMGLEVAGVDILRSNAGPLILEVNASPGLEGIEGTTGVDIASQIIRFVETNAKPVPVKVV